VQLGPGGEERLEIGWLILEHETGDQRPEPWQGPFYPYMPNRDEVARVVKRTWLDVDNRRIALRSVVDPGSAALTKGAGDETATCGSPIP
jgi:hypothetical protein